MKKLTKKQKYLEVLKTFDDFVIVKEWAEKFAKMYPDDLEQANKQAAKQKHETTGLREICARISSTIGKGGFDQNIEIDMSEKPKKVRYITSDEFKSLEEKETESDIEPLRRDEILRKAKNELDKILVYRLEEFDLITKSLNQYFETNFQVDHAKALKNPSIKGEHHPDNLQILLQAHNGKKSSKNWERFSKKEQITYINKAIELQKLIMPRLELNFDNKILTMLLNRLEKVYDPK